MRIWSLCLWLLLMSASLGYAQAEGTPDGTETSEEEPDCD
jgi:hypothetical protein